MSCSGAAVFNSEAKMTELPLFDPPKELVGFAKYDADHPAIWIEFRKLALDLIARGCKHYGAKAIFEVIRYHRIIDYDKLDFKVNNTYTRDYARKFRAEFPQYKDFFETRKPPK